MKRAMVWVVGCALAAGGCGDGERQSNPAADASARQSPVGQFERDIATSQARDAAVARRLPSIEASAMPAPAITPARPTTGGEIALASATQPMDSPVQLATATGIAPTPNDPPAASPAVAAEVALATRLAPLAEQSRTLELRQRYPEALALREQIVELLEQHYGLQSWQATNARLAVAHCRRLSKLDYAGRRKAEDLEAAIARVSELVADQQPQAALESALLARTLAVSLWGDADHIAAAAAHRCGELQQGLGEFDKAEAMFRTALQSQRLIHGSEHPDTLASLSSLGMLYHHVRRFDEAEPLLREAVSASAEVWGRYAPQYATHLANLGGSLMQNGKEAEAAGWLELAVAVQRKSLPENDPFLALTLFNLGSTYYRLHKFDAAILPLSEASDMFAERLRRDHPMTLRALASQAMTHLARREFATAEPLLLEVAAVHRRRLGNTHPEVAAIEYALGLLHALQGHYPQARPLLATALQSQQQALGNEHPTTRETADTLAEVEAKLAERGER